MGRQSSAVLAVRTEPTVRTTADIRLDPHALPHRFKYHTGLDGNAAEAAVVLSQDLAVVCRRLPSGIPMAMRMEIANFEGVAIRVVTGEDPSDLRIVVELMHRDPLLSLPLAVAADTDEVIADWQAWAKVLSLPLLVVEADGSVRALETRIGSVAVKPVRPRRRRSVLARRRPRFLTRRKMGAVVEPVMVPGEEIASWE